MFKKTVEAIMLVLAVAAIPSVGLAVTTTWQVETGNWSVGANWDSGEPGSSDEAFIRNNGTAQITSSNSETCYDLTVGYWAGQEGTLDISGGSLAVSNYLTVARYSDGFGTVNMSGGTVSAVREYIGDGAGSKGGIFNQSAGTNTVSDYFTIGDDANSTGAYTLSGTGVLNVHWGTISNSGTGTFTQTGGTLNGDGTDGWLRVGRYSTGEYSISGGSFDVRKVEVSDNTSGSGTFKVIGDDSTIDCVWYVQRGGNGSLESVLDADGISAINASDTAAISGTWTVSDIGAVAGKYNVLVAANGLSGSFDTVVLPNETEWSWGIDNGTTLYVEYAPIPEPMTLALLGMGTGVFILRKKR